MKSLKTILELFKLTFNKLLSSKKIYLLPLLAAVLLFRKVVLAKGKQSQIVKVALSDFFSSLDKGQVSRVLVKPKSLFFIGANSSAIQKTTHSLLPKKLLFEKLINSKVAFQTVSADKFTPFILALAASALITFGINWFFSQKIHSLRNMENHSKTKFSDVVGVESSKIALTEVINYMKDPHKFTQMGARMRRGIIFYGPSGTGKTTLAKACAGQAQVPFYACNAAQFKEIYVGMGAKKVRELFQKAKKNAPSIIYIDEIDAMGNRNSVLGNLDGSSSEKNTTINQLLTEMDGFDSSQNVLVIGSTNKLELLDGALLRPGRFDLKIRIPLPSPQERKNILAHHLKNKAHELPEDYLRKVTEKLNGWSGADLENLANESVYTAFRNQRKAIKEEDIELTLKSLRNE